MQLRRPDSANGPNTTSLIEAQKNFAQFGAASQKWIGKVRAPEVDEQIEPSFRFIDSEVDNFLSSEDLPKEWPKDLTTLYWWRPGYWLRRSQ